jgi:hypothetical protein
MNKQLKQTINKAFGVDIDNRTRAGNHAIARQLYCYIRYKTTVLPLSEIGKEVSRNHATVIFAKHKIYDVLNNPQDRYHDECKKIYNFFLNNKEMLDQSGDLVLSLLEENQMLKEEIRQLKSGKPTILDHLKALPEHVQENVMFRLNSIVKMESSKVMRYNQSVKIIN